jgi:hypothetical protein
MAPMVVRAAGRGDRTIAKISPLPLLWEIRMSLDSCLPVGTRLGPYEILAPRSAGGMGEVFRRS